MVFLLCWLIFYPVASWVELYSQFQVENSVLPSSYFPSWHPISLCFIHKIEGDKTVLILSPNSGIAFSCNWCKCPLQNDDGKRHPSTCFGRWYQDNSKISLPFACQKVCLTTHPFPPPERLNYPSATETRHVISYTKEIHAHDEQHSN